MSAAGPPAVRATAARRATLVAGLLCTAAGGMAAGMPGVLAGSLGTAVVVFFFWSGALPLMVADAPGTRAGVGMAVLLLTYTLRLALALLVLRLLARPGVIQTRWLGGTIIICAVVWTVAQAIVVLRWPHRPGG